MADSTSDNLLARLDERTISFARSLDHIAAENRALAERMLTALEKHAVDDKNHFDRHDGMLGSEDERLKKLENWQANIMGRMAVVAIGAGTVMAVVGWLLKL